MDLATGLLLLLVGLAAGFATGLLVAQRRGPDAQALAELLDGRAREERARASGDLDARRAAVEGLVAPLRDTLGRVEAQLHGLERARLESYARLSEQVGSMRESNEELRDQTAALVTALRAPQVRGRWGEVQLRRVVEMAGMVAHCDFVEQPSARGDAGVVRPDLVVRLAGGKQVVVDSKVPLAAYLEAAEAADPDVRKERLRAHARQLRAHVDDLAAKAYWAQFQPAPEFVVLFVPGEAFLAPALEADPSLLEHAMGKRVILATPTTLMSLLRTVAYAWQQDALTSHAREVFELGRELYDRLGTLGGHLDKVGRSVSRLVGDYNRAVSSLESRVLVTARRLRDLDVVEEDLAAPCVVEDATRPLAAPELVEDAARSEAADPGLRDVSVLSRRRSADG